MRNRKGFIKLALKHGWVELLVAAQRGGTTSLRLTVCVCVCRAQLVPVFSFGENELFDQMENPSGSSLRTLQVRGRSLSPLIKSRHRKLVQIQEVQEHLVPDVMSLCCPQDRFQSIVGVSMPLFHARGVFQYSFGLMPYRQPIHTVGTIRR